MRQCWQPSAWRAKVPVDVLANAPVKAQVKVCLQRRPAGLARALGTDQPARAPKTLQWQRCAVASLSRRWHVLRHLSAAITARGAARRLYSAGHTPDLPPRFWRVRAQQRHQHRPLCRLSRVAQHVCIDSRRASWAQLQRRQCLQTKHALQRLTGAGLRQQVLAKRTLLWRCVPCNFFSRLCAVAQAKTTSRHSGWSAWAVGVVRFGRSTDRFCW